MRHVSPLTSSETIVIEVVEFSTPQEYALEDPLHLREGEGSSSPSTKFEPLPTSPYHVALDLDQESTLILHDESPQMENSWAMEIYESPTLESKGKDSTDEHGSFILDTPHEPCLHQAFPESAMLRALGMHKDYNCLMVLSCKMFRRMIIDAYVYHKHCRFHVCTMVLTLQLKLQ
jgi:hypothetical protein